MLSATICFRGQPVVALASGRRPLTDTTYRPQFGRSMGTTTHPLLICPTAPVVNPFRRGAIACLRKTGHIPVRHGPANRTVNTCQFNLLTALSRVVPRHKTYRASSPKVCHRVDVPPATASRPPRRTEPATRGGHRGRSAWNFQVKSPQPGLSR